MSASKQIQVIFLLLVALSIVRGERQFTYFKLNLVWPNSYCNTPKKLCKEPVPQKFKVHGLWPYNADHTQALPYKPSGDFPLTQDLVGSWNFSRSLSSIWPNLIHGEKDVHLWQREWDRYGVRTGMSAEDYFYLTVKFAKKYEKLYDSLLKSGVVTPSNKLYQREVLYNEIAAALGSSPTITCNDYKYVKKLMDVSIYIDIDGITFNSGNHFNYCGRSKTMVLFPTKETVTSSREHPGIASALELLCGQAYGAKKYYMLGVYMQRLFFLCVIFAFAYLSQLGGGTVGVYIRG